MRAPLESLDVGPESGGGVNRVVRAVASGALAVMLACGRAEESADSESWAVAPPAGAPTLCVAAVQFDAVPGEPEANRAAMERLLREAAGRGAELVLFHENALIDYALDVRALAEPVPEGPTCVQFAALAEELDLFVGIGLAERAGERVHLTQAYFGPAGFVGRYRKTWLFHNHRDARRDEWAHFDPGSGPEETLELAGVRAATLICADADSERCVERLRALEPELVLFPNNRSDFHEPQTFAHLARRIGAPVLAANRSGQSWQHACNGGSFLLAADGAVLARANRVGREEILICELPLAAHVIRVQAGRSPVR
jgi:predicted amidohydrolase